MTQRRRGRHRSPKRSAGYQLIDSGQSDSEIARRLGVSRTAVAHWRRERGVPPLSPADNKSAPAPASTRRRRSARKPIGPEVGVFVLDAIAASSAHAAQQPRRPTVSRRLGAPDRESSVWAAAYPRAPVSGGADVDPDELAAAGL